LDDLKGCLRSLPSHASEGLESLREILLGLETEARKQTSLDGESFDLVAWELDQMDNDDTWETFEPEIARKILQVVLDEADDIAPQVERENGYPFFLSLGFHLPRPDKHPYMKEAEISGDLQTFSNGQKMAVDSQSLQGALNLDFYTGEAPDLIRSAETGIVRVATEDPRAGDKVKLQMSLVYPLKAEGYFLATFDAVSKAMRLKL
jgi:hypothetical protein